MNTRECLEKASRSQIGPEELCRHFAESVSRLTVMYQTLPTGKQPILSKSNQKNHFYSVIFTDEQAAATIQLHQPEMVAVEEGNALPLLLQAYRLEVEGIVFNPGLASRHFLSKHYLLNLIRHYVATYLTTNEGAWMIMINGHPLQVEYQSGFHTTSIYLTREDAETKAVSEPGATVEFQLWTQILDHLHRLRAHTPYLHHGFAEQFLLSMSHMRIIQAGQSVSEEEKEKKEADSQPIKAQATTMHPNPLIPEQEPKEEIKRVQSQVQQRHEPKPEIKPEIDQEPGPTDNLQTEVEQSVAKSNENIDSTPNSFAEPFDDGFAEFGTDPDFESSTQSTSTSKSTEDVQKTGESDHSHLSSAKEEDKLEVIASPTPIQQTSSEPDPVPQQQEKREFEPQENLEPPATEPIAEPSQPVEEEQKHKEPQEKRQVSIAQPEQDPDPFGSTQPEWDNFTDPDFVTEETASGLVQSPPTESEPIKSMEEPKKTTEPSPSVHPSQLAESSPPPVHSQPNPTNQEHKQKPAVSAQEASIPSDIKEGLEKLERATIEGQQMGKGWEICEALSELRRIWVIVDYDANLVILAGQDERPIIDFFTSQHYAQMMISEAHRKNKTLPPMTTRLVSTKKIYRALSSRHPIVWINRGSDIGWTSVMGDTLSYVLQLMSQKAKEKNNS